METLENSRVTSTTNSESRVLKVRCPSCFKLYSVDAMEIHDSKPQFECIKCYTKFWFPYPEVSEHKEILGFPVAWLSGGEGVDSQNLEGRHGGKTEILTKFHCPRCQASYHAGDKECPKCGVVFAKLDFIESHPKWVVSSPGLKRLWNLVMENYGELENHRRFVHSCQKENNLLYASQQYRRLLEAHSGDEIALQMQKEIEILSLTLEGLGPSSKRVTWSRKLLPRISTLIMVLGGILIGIGFMVPAARNLIGLGVAIIFFTVTLEWFFQRSG